jgi:hypothetical protein
MKENIFLAGIVVIDAGLLDAALAGDFTDTGGKIALAVKEIDGHGGNGCFHGRHGLTNLSIISYSTYRTVGLSVYKINVFRLSSEKWVGRPRKRRLGIIHFYIMISIFIDEYGQRARPLNSIPRSGSEGLVRHRRQKSIDKTHRGG